MRKSYTQSYTGQKENKRMEKEIKEKGGEGKRTRRGNRHYKEIF
jgi:hypothetical protein